MNILYIFAVLCLLLLGYTARRDLAPAIRASKKLEAKISLSLAILLFVFILYNSPSLKEYVDRLLSPLWIVSLIGSIGVIGFCLRNRKTIVGLVVFLLFLIAGGCMLSIGYGGGPP